MVLVLVLEGSELCSKFRRGMTKTTKSEKTKKIKFKVRNTSEREGERPRHRESERETHDDMQVSHPRVKGKKF